jgi:hypothetical protein
MAEFNTLKPKVHYFEPDDADVMVFSKEPKLCLVHFAVEDQLYFFRLDRAHAEHLVYEIAKATGAKSAGARKRKASST